MPFKVYKIKIYINIKGAKRPNISLIYIVCFFQEDILER
jgi:hypothetical protein